MNNAAPRKFGMGARVHRLEDRAFVTGRGRYLDDLPAEGALRAALLRSSMAHARVRLSGLDAARQLPGVHLILTHEDLAGIGTLPIDGVVSQPNGKRYFKPPHPILADRVVRYVGEPIAFVVADDVETARAAADSIEVDYEPLPVALDMHTAIGDAPAIWTEAGGNVAFTHERGDRKATDAAFATAARVSRVEVVNNRVVANYMETRGVVAEYDAKSGRYTLAIGTQGGHGMRDMIAKHILHVSPENIRVITPDVGGGFGTKMFTYPEYPLAAIAAKKLGRQVKWIGDRSEHFLADKHGRDNVAVAEMAMDADGRFLAMRIDLLANMGAYLSEFGAFVPEGGLTMATGVYDVPMLFARLRGVYTNTQPIDAYRGAGRPEAAYLVERLVDQCGRDTGLGPLEIRRRNFIASSAMPYETRGGRIYDTGEFDGHLARALALGDFDGFAKRAEASKAAGKTRGIGLSTYIEACAFPGSEGATVILNEDGTATLLIGTQSNGQGHATAYAQFIAGHLGLDYDRIKMIQGDTDAVPDGGGTGGSRSVPLGAVSVDRASIKLAGQLRQRAAVLLEAQPDTLEFADGTIRISGSNRGITLAELARRTEDKTVLRAYDESFEQPEPTYPNGTHLAEVEVDPETGVIEIVSYVVVDDFGATVNPLLLEGQVQGGIGQGVGQALYEQAVYDENGQLLTATFQDYAMPRADGVPSIRFETRNIPSTTNAFGIKGAGEAGTIGSCPAVVNAVIDALNRGWGITHIDMPATPQRVWAAIRAAG